MRLKPLWPNVLHGMCIGAVLFLAGFTIREKRDDCEADLQREVLASLQVGLPEIMASAKKSFEQVEENAAHYPNQTSADYFQRAAHTQAKADSLLVLLDSLEQNPEAELLYFVQGQLPVFYSNAFKRCDYDRYVETVLPKFEPVDWLFRSWKNDSHERFAAVLAQAKMQVGLIKTGVLHYCLTKTDNTSCGFERYGLEFAVEQAFPSIGDTVTGDLIMMKYRDRMMHPRLLLNSQELTEERDKAKFSVRHDKPGNYPLHFSIEQRDRLTDSVRVSEKTYWLRVRE